MSHTVWLEGQFPFMFLFLGFFGLPVCIFESSPPLSHRTPSDISPPKNPQTAHLIWPEGALAHRWRRFVDVSSGQFRVLQERRSRKQPAVAAHSKERCKMAPSKAALVGWEHAAGGHSVLGSPHL